MKKLQKKGFTLIELIVVIAVLALLVLLAVPRLFGETEKAFVARITTNARAIQDASERFYFDTDDWPIDDQSYSAEAIEAETDSIYDITGKIDELKSGQDYHYINLDEIEDYVSVNVTDEQYIINFPDEKVYVITNDKNNSENNNEDDTELVYECGVNNLNSYTQEEIDDLLSQGYTPVATAEELNDVRNNLDGKYVQINDIDLSNYSDGEGWEPIGEDPWGENTAFTGIYDGGNYQISGLTINRPDDDEVGLFGVVLGENEYDGIIKNVGLIDVNVKGKYSPGGLVGWLEDGKIENSYTTGLIHGDYTAGGLVGWNEKGIIKKSCSSSTITTDRGNGGGLVGWGSYGEISNSYATGDVINSSESGGFIGYHDKGIIINSYSTGDVKNIYEGSGSRPFGTGGFVGYNGGGTIINSHSTGDVEGHYGVGGFAGANQKGWQSDKEGLIINSYSIGDVKGVEEVGGFVGLNTDSTIENSYSIGDVIGENIVGGFAGLNTSEIKNSYAIGNVIGEEEIGGFVGYDYYKSWNGEEEIGTAENSYYDTTTTGQSVSAGGTGLTTEQMQQQESFEDWDFESIWEITPGNYPTLR